MQRRSALGAREAILARDSARPRPVNCLRLTIAVAASVVVMTLGIPAAAADNHSCRLSCDGPEVGLAPGAVTARYAAQVDDSAWVASNSAPVDHPYTYQLFTPCAIDTAAGG